LANERPSAEDAMTELSYEQLLEQRIARLERRVAELAGEEDRANEQLNEMLEEKKAKEEQWKKAHQGFPGFMVELLGEDWMGKIIGAGIGIGLAVLSLLLLSLVR
jgi:hypothetical protein